MVLRSQTDMMESYVRLRCRTICVYLFLIVQGFMHGEMHAMSEPFLEERALKIVNLTQAAYCTEQLVGWNCTVCSSFPEMLNVSILHGQPRHVRGFIGIDVGTDFDAEETALGDERVSEVSEVRELHVELQGKEGGEFASRSRFRDTIDDGRGLPSRNIVVTFSGTDPTNYKNWYDDLEIGLVSHSYGNGAACVDCKVHEGFLATYEVVQEQVRATVAEHLRYNPTARVLITGHSLGGALATLCFLDLMDVLGDDVAFAPLYVFGTPRVGNAPFATYTASRGVPIYRLVHHRDPIPHLPLKRWGFHHPPQEVFYDSLQKSYKMCDGTGEDPTCSAKFWAIVSLLHIQDHVHYLEVDYTKSFLKCKLGPVVKDDE